MDIPSIKPFVLFDEIIAEGEATARTMAKSLERKKMSKGEETVLLLLHGWLYEQDLLRAQKREDQALKSIQVSEVAALASKEAAKWTMVAAFVAAGAAMISLVGVLVPIINKDEPQKVISQDKAQPQPAAKPAAVNPHQNK